MENKIYHLDRLKQPISFGGLNFGSISPTDIDGMIEYRNVSYIFFEVKFRNTDIARGQRLALERLVKDTAQRNKFSIALIVDHNAMNTKQCISLKDCVVRELYHSNEKKWRKTKYKNMKTITVVNEWIEIIEQKLLH